MKFEVGEIAIMWCPNWPAGHKGEVEIVCVPQPLDRNYTDGTSIPAGHYVISGPYPNPNGDGTWITLEQYLRKRRPPIPPEVLTIFQPVSEPA